MRQARSIWIAMMLISFAAMADSRLQEAGATERADEALDPIAKVLAFRAACESGDFDLARSFLNEDPRVWYATRNGEGSPLELGAGRYEKWDEHFRSKGDVGDWIIEGNRVWAIVVENNDYYRLLERKGISSYRVTYFLDAELLIEGYMISAADPDHPDTPRNDRFAEFEAWARSKYPEEWSYLRPGGKLDPTGDRAERTRKLLVEWRNEIGLPPID